MKDTQIYFMYLKNIHKLVSLDIVILYQIKDNISYPLFVPRIRKGTHLKESVFPEAEG